MTDSDFFELANRVIDGVESDQDREALNAVIDRSVARRLEFEQLSAVVSVLDAVRPVEPPEGLRNRILAAMPREAPAGARARQISVWQQIKEFTAGRPAYALAYAVTMGLVVGLIGLAAVIGGTGIGDGSPTMGTMARASEAFAVADESELNGAGIQAKASLLIRDAEFVLVVEVESDEPVEVVVTPVSEVTTWYGVELEGGARLTGSKLEPDGLLFPAEGSSAVRVSGLRGDLGGVHCMVSIRRDGRVLGEMMLAEPPLVAE